MNPGRQTFGSVPVIGRARALTKQCQFARIQTQRRKDDGTALNATDKECYPMLRSTTQSLVSPVFAWLEAMTLA